MSTLRRNEIAQRCIEPYQSLILHCSSCLLRPECTDFRNPYLLDCDSRWTFRVVGSFYSWKHKFCTLLGVATASELGKGDTSRSFQRGRGCERWHKGWAQGSCSGSEALQIPRPHICRGARQALSPPEPPAATCPRVSFAEHGLPFLCCARPGQWSVVTVQRQVTEEG